MIIYKKRIRSNPHTKTYSAKWLHFNNLLTPRLHNVILKRHARAATEKKLAEHLAQQTKALGFANHFPKPIDTLCDSNQFAYYKLPAAPLYTSYPQLLRQNIKHRLHLFRDLLLVVKILHHSSIQLIHNDLSPGNILLRNDSHEDKNKIIIIDLADAQLFTSNKDHLFITKGKPHYSSPEQRKGLTTTIPSDIFQLGCILFDLLFGKQFLDIHDCAQYTLENLPQLHHPQLTVDVETTQWLCSKMLADEPSHRFQSINECIIGIDSLMNSAVI